jgi:hypothetical protein
MDSQEGSFWDFTHPEHLSWFFSKTAAIERAKQLCEDDQHRNRENVEAVNDFHVYIGKFQMPKVLNTAGIEIQMYNPNGKFPKATEMKMHFEELLPPLSNRKFYKKKVADYNTKATKKAMKATKK